MSSHFVRLLCSGFLHPRYLWQIVCVRSSNFSRRHSSLSVTWSACQILATITSFDPVSESTPAAALTEIEEDSAFTEAHDSLRVLFIAREKTKYRDERLRPSQRRWSSRNYRAKEAVICNAEFRIRRAVQQDEDEQWKKRMANEDKITTNAIETLRSDFNKKSAKMADEVVCLKSRHHGRSLVLLGVEVVVATLRPGLCHTHSWPTESNSKDVYD